MATMTGPLIARARIRRGWTASVLTPAGTRLLRAAWRRAAGPAGRRSLLSAALTLALAPSPARAEKWPAIPREDLELAQPIVDRTADAEVIFWEVQVEDILGDASVSRTLWHHVRLKVFTERGREAQSKVDLVSDRGQQISEIAARSVSPAGRVVELSAKEVYERTLVKANRVRVQARSFVVPAVEVGSIVEYRWREFRGSRFRSLHYFDLQRDLPCQRITYRVKPIQFRGAPPLQMLAHNAAPSAFASDGSGYYSTSVTRVPAYVEEPDMPPEFEARRWMFLYYATEEYLDVARRWREEARELERADDDVRKGARELGSQAREIAGDSTDPEERLRRIFTYSRTRILNLHRKGAGLSDDERSRLKPNPSARATLEIGRGTAEDINRLFATLCAAAGFEVRRARLPDRQRFYFDAQSLTSYLSAGSVAVRVGDQWRFFDPASHHVPFGMLRWQEEDVPALVQEKGEPLWLRTPLTPASRSAVRRIGTFQLLEDGTLQGEARLEFSGHLDGDEKLRIESSSDEERRRELRNAVLGRMPGAEVSDVTCEPMDSADSTLVFRYRLRMPGFARAAGRRLLFQPGIFQYGREPRILPGARRNDFDFRYPWSEWDLLDIRLPDGYELEHPEPPGDYDVADLCGHRIEFSIADEGRRLVYRRVLRLERYQVALRHYAPLKQMFETIHERDQRTLALRPTGTPGP